MNSIFLIEIFNVLLIIHGFDVNISAHCENAFFITTILII